MFLPSLNFGSNKYFSPKEPPPPPPAEPEWSEIESEINHLQDDNFKDFLKKKKHVLVMFYAPCKALILHYSLRPMLFFKGQPVCRLSSKNVAIVDLNKKSSSTYKVKLVRLISI